MIMKNRRIRVNQGHAAAALLSRGRHSIPEAAQHHRAAAAVKPVDCTAGEATAAQHAGRRATRTPEALGCVDAGDARVHLNNYEWPPSAAKPGPGAVPPAGTHAAADA